MVLATAPEPRVHWGNHNITESYPGISGALTYSQAREFYRSSFTDLYRRMGVPERKLRANRDRLGRMVGYLDGRIYYRLDDWQVLHGQMPVFDLIRAGWEDAMGITGSARAERQWSKTRAAASLPIVAWHAAGHRRAAKRFLRWWDRFMTEIYNSTDRNIDDLTPTDLIALYRRVWDEAGNRWGVTLANGIYGLLVMRAGTTLLRRWTGGGPELLVGLLVGGPENRSLAAARAAIALAEQVDEHPQLRKTLLTAESEDEDRALWTDLTTGHFGADLAAAANDYLRRYGDRALHDLKLDEPTPRQRPWMLLSVLRPFVRQGATVAASRAAEASTAAKARQQLHDSCRNPLRRAVLHTLLAQMRWLARFREDSRFCRTQLFGISREVMWRLGAELAKAGLLDDPRDVIDLTIDEVFGAFEGTLPTSDPRAVAALRRSERRRYEQNPVLPSLMSVARDRPFAAALRSAQPVTTATASPSALDDAPGTLRGLGSSGGSVRGRAKIVLDPSIAPDSCQDRILIARETDPGWLTLMMAASGLVVERGTLLSHTAITGRLLGVPTVVAVDGATSRIPDGALIELDGTTGTVRILEGSAP
jgi:pyruvate,water dikinase